MTSEVTRRTVLRYGLSSLALGGAVTAGGSLLAGCSGSGSGSGGTSGGASVLDQLRKTGTVKIGIANEKPYSYKNSSGAVEGLVVDIARAVFKPLGVDTLDATVGAFDSLIPGLQANHFDVIVCGMYITPQRCQAVVFSDPYYQVGQGMIVKRGNPLGLHSVADVLKNPKARVGTQNGSSQVQELKDAKVPAGQTTLFQTETQAMAALTGGRVDAIYFPALEVAALLQTNAGAAIERADPYTQLAGPGGKPAYGYASFPCRTSDHALVDAINTRVHAIRDDGSLLTILQKYGLTKAELPDPSATATALCK